MWALLLNRWLPAGLPARPPAVCWKGSDQTCPGHHQAHQRCHFLLPPPLPTSCPAGCAAHAAQGLGHGWRGGQQAQVNSISGTGGIGHTQPASHRPGRHTRLATALARGGPQLSQPCPWLSSTIPRQLLHCFLFCCVLSCFNIFQAHSTAFLFGCILWQGWVRCPRGVWRLGEAPRQALQ